MLYICNLIAIIFLNICAVIINFVLWCTYANIYTIKIWLQNQKVYIYMADINMYHKKMFLKNLQIVYYYQYKSVIRSDYICYDISNILLPQTSNVNQIH